MALFMLTNGVLEVVLGATWWSLKKTYNGIYYVIYGDEDDPNTIELSQEDVEQNKQLLNQLLKQTEHQQLEIKKLTDHISILTDYMKPNIEALANDQSGLTN